MCTEQDQQKGIGADRQAISGLDQQFNHSFQVTVEDRLLLLHLTTWSYVVCL